MRWKVTSYCVELYNKCCDCLVTCLFLPVTGWKCFQDHIEPLYLVTFANPFLKGLTLIAGISSFFLLLSLPPLRCEITRFTPSSRQRLIHGWCEILAPMSVVWSAQWDFDIGRLTEHQLQSYRDVLTFTPLHQPSAQIKLVKKKKTHTEITKFPHAVTWFI